MEITSVASITVICYIMAQVVKISALDNKWIPVTVGILGGILGAAESFFVAGFPASDLFSAVAVGIVSGLASTGANQVYKQLGGGK